MEPLNILITGHQGNSDFVFFFGYVQLSAAERAYSAGGADSAKRLAEVNGETGSSLSTRVLLLLMIKVCQLTLTMDRPRSRNLSKRIEPGQGDTQTYPPASWSQILRRPFRTGERTL